MRVFLLGIVSAAPYFRNHLERPLNYSSIFFLFCKLETLIFHLKEGLAPSQTFLTYCSLPLIDLCRISPRILLGKYNNHLRVMVLKL